MTNTQSSISQATNTMDNDIIFVDMLELYMRKKAKQHQETNTTIWPKLPQHPFLEFHYESFGNPWSIVT